MLDVDECLQVALQGGDACAPTPNSFCDNIIGGFDCLCFDGYSMIAEECVRGENLIHAHTSTSTHLHI